VNPHSKSNPRFTLLAEQPAPLNEGLAFVQRLSHVVE